MYLIARVKLENNYDVNRIIFWHDYIKIVEIICKLCYKQHFQHFMKTRIKKWNYNTEVGIAIQKLKNSISNIDEDIYKDLFTVALASILLEVSNLYRNGKCLSYKKNWKERSISQDDVFRRFDEK